MRWAAARVFMNPAVYTTRIAAELSVTRRLATFLLEALGAMVMRALYNPGHDAQGSVVDGG
jgi:hypothetical protein